MRSAVFVDAGYLYAQGSKVIGRAGLRRVDIQLNLPEAIRKLKSTAVLNPAMPLSLRIYWYDGLLRGELSFDQNRLSNTEDVKLRLGIVNVAGQQKGVDSLIVTDLVELARNHAITDAVLLSGDEDLRIGVQIAQSFGVRVHLIGIQPSRGSQSLSLLQEADTTTEWGESEIRTLLTAKPGISSSIPTSDDPVRPQMEDQLASLLQQAIADFVSFLRKEDLNAIRSLQESAMIPREYDRGLLARCRDAVQRDLDSAEKHLMRTTLREMVGKRL